MPRPRSEQEQKEYEEDLQDVRDIGRCLGMALFETIRCAVYNAHNPRGINDREPELGATDNLVEGWTNLANKLIAFAEKSD